MMMSSESTIIPGWRVGLHEVTQRITDKAIYRTTPYVDDAIDSTWNVYLGAVYAVLAQLSF
jgi:hypothetical protein